MASDEPVLDDEKPDVFLSYASEDRDRASALISALELHGFTVWWDKQIKANDEFSPVIERHLDAARCVVVLWTSNSVGKSFVREEAIRGQEKLVPVLLDNVKPPLGFGQASNVDLRRWHGDELALVIDRLVENVSRVAQRESNWSKPANWLVLRSLFRDLKSRIILSLILAAFATAWLLWGRTAWHTADLEWALLLAVLATLGWLSIRASQFARSNLGRWVAVVFIGVAAAGWGIGVATYYAPPPFAAGKTGILVARFQGDLDDRTQYAWVEQLRAQKSGQSTSVDMRTAFEPLDVKILLREIGSDQEARRFAEQANALSVIWGRKGARVAMTFADLPGFVKLDDLAIANVGTLDIRDDPGMLEDLTRSFLFFASAYGAFATSDYGRARRLLQRAQEPLKTGGSTLTTAGVLSATTHLLLGNTYVYMGCGTAGPGQCIAAIDNYEAALEIFVKDESRGNIFVEASNNLAVATSKLTGSFASAVRQLEDAAFVCRSLGNDQPLACTFVAYNLALAHSESGKYAQALELLTRVCGESMDRRARGQGSMFPAECRQQQAYAAAKLGERSVSPEESNQWFAEALRFIEQAVAALPPRKASGLPPKLAITRARIALGRQDYRTAVDELGSVVIETAQGAFTLRPEVAQRYPELDGTEIAMLYTIARICTHAMPPDKTPLAKKPSAESMTYFTRKVASCL